MSQEIRDFEASAALFATQCIQFGCRGTESQVVAEHRDVDVLRKPGYESERFGP